MSDNVSPATNPIARQQRSPMPFHRYEPYHKLLVVRLVAVKRHRRALLPCDRVGGGGNVVRHGLLSVIDERNGRCQMTGCEALAWGLEGTRSGESAREHRDGVAGRVGPVAADKKESAAHRSPDY